MFSPYLQLSESDTTENQVKRMYDRAINKQLICKTYDELINLFGYPENIIQQTISKNGQSFNEQQLRYYPLVFLLEEYVSVTIVDDIVVRVGAKSWNRTEENYEKMRKQQKQCDKANEYFNFM